MSKTYYLPDRANDPVRVLDRTQTLFSGLMLQSYYGLYVYEKVLGYVKPHWICEIGTATGMLSLYFANWAFLNHIPFMTIDNGSAEHAWPLNKEAKHLIELLGGVVLRENCFRSKRLKQFIERHNKGFLLCDGGNKRKELATFGPKVYVGTVITVHDWGTEACLDDMIPEVEFLQPFHSESIVNGAKIAVMTRVPTQLKG